MALESTDPADHLTEPCPVETIEGPICGKPTDPKYGMCIGHWNGIKGQFERYGMSPLLDALKDTDKLERLGERLHGLPGKVTLVEPPSYEYKIELMASPSQANIEHRANEFAVDGWRVVSVVQPQGRGLYMLLEKQNG